MAPTELLAEQHYRGLAPLLEQLGIRCALLTGSTPAKTKRSVTAQLAAGEIDFAIGTHALISGGVAYADLGLVVTDEQHRFGVAQRTALAEKGEHPHTLVMSATPIPRTLALILYGDLDVSVIDQLPPGPEAYRNLCRYLRLLSQAVRTLSANRWRRGGRCTSSVPWCPKTTICPTSGRL